MQAQRILSAVGCLCLAAGSVWAQPPAGPPEPAQPRSFSGASAAAASGAGLVDVPATGMSNQPPPLGGPGMYPAPAAPGYPFGTPLGATPILPNQMPPAAGPGMLPDAGVPGLHTPPGNTGMMAFPGLGPQDPGRPLGEEDQLPGVPQAWTMSKWNPAPRLIVRTESLFFRTSYPTSRPLAVQPQVNANGQFQLNELGVGPHTPYYVTPRLVFEYFVNDAWSLEANGFANIGPHRTFSLGAQDFTYFLSGPFSGDTTTFAGPLVNIPAGFPTVADNAVVRISQDIGNIELMSWKHWAPPKGLTSDFALGLGGRYVFMNERINVKYQDRLPDPANPVTTGQISDRSSNDLYGIQFGAKATVQSPLKWVRSTLESKIALLNDDARHNHWLYTTTETPVSTSRYTRSNFAQLFEGSYNMEFFLSQYVTAYAGFQVIYINHVERAEQQLNPDLSAFIAGEKRTGEILMYGPKIGLMMNW